MPKTIHGEGDFVPTAFETRQAHQATENYKAFKKKQGKSISRTTAQAVYARSIESIKRRRKARQGKKR